MGHGGIGKGEWDLSYLRTAERPISSKRLFEDLVLYNLLWSDPVPEDQQGCAGVHDSPRDDHKSLISMFGPDVTEAFCLRNNLDVVVRSHATMYDGCGYEVMHSGRCVTVFSARDYEGCQNDGSILNIVTSPLGKLVITPQVQLGITKRMVLGPSCRNRGPLAGSSSFLLRLNTSVCVCVCAQGSSFGTARFPLGRHAYVIL